LDFELNADQEAITAALGSLLARHAGPARAIELGHKGEYDFALDAALQEAGFLEIARGEYGEQTGPLEAALVVEAVAKAGGVVGIGAAVLIAPGVLDQRPIGPVAVSTADPAGPVRFAGHARTLLISDGDTARLAALAPGAAEPVASNFGYPMARPSVDVAGSRSLGPGSGERLRSWWRLALAAEAVGTMAGALEVTLEYVKRRRQFGRAIGSFQVVQHRLAECSVLLEGSRWLSYEAAYEGAPPDKSATAAAHALAAAGRVFAETHQLTGAMGFTREHDLHVWSMRLQALRLELGGVAGQRRAAAEARWVSSS
jgi:alkylation response protein AidB-like acyl-CoA dehydrogenase